MSYGIVRIQKFTKGSVHGIKIHDQREKDISHTNKDIDFSKSELNYQLSNLESNYHKLINKRIENLSLKKAVRKDAIVMAQVLVTSDSEFFTGIKLSQQENFFKDSYEFLKKQYGAENTISATVHLDEKTPHMHFNFVPVTNDGRLSAKSLFNPTTLRKLQDNFFEEVGSKYNLERGEKGSKTKHLETQEYKDLKNKEQELKENISNLNLEAENKQNKLNNISKQITSLKNSKQALNEQIQARESQNLNLILETKSLNQKINKSILKEEIEKNKLIAEIKEYKQELNLYSSAVNRAKEVIKFYDINIKNNIGNSYSLEKENVEHIQTGIINKEDYVKIPLEQWKFFKESYTTLVNYKETSKELEKRLDHLTDVYLDDDITELQKEIFWLKSDNKNLEKRNNKISFSLKSAIEESETKYSDLESLVNKTLNQLPKNISSEFIDEFKNQKNIQEQFEEQIMEDYWDLEY